MKLLFDFLPVALFFLSYKFYGIYIATAVVMIASSLQIGVFWIKHRKIKITHAITLALVLILGGATLFFRNDLFIKWKPTAVFWVFSLLFLGSQLIGTKPLIQRMMNDKVTLPQKIWKNLNLSWAIFFGCIGTINLYIAYNFDTNVWVAFKLFGVLGSTMAFGILQSFYMAKYLKYSLEERSEQP